MLTVRPDMPAKIAARVRLFAEPTKIATAVARDRAVDTDAQAVELALNARRSSRF
jgi:hypothetical protein